MRTQLIIGGLLASVALLPEMVPDGTVCPASSPGFHVPSIDQSIVVVWSQGSLACRREQSKDRGVRD